MEMGHLSTVELEPQLNAVETVANVNSEQDTFHRGLVSNAAVSVDPNSYQFDTTLLESSCIKEITWDILLMFGGGLALAKVH